jgi:hypothetical protein
MGTAVSVKVSVCTPAVFRVAVKVGTLVDHGEVELAVAVEVAHRLGNGSGADWEGGRGEKTGNGTSFQKLNMQTTAGRADDVRYRVSGCVS